jgi:excisionase family DNA binding protein
MNAAAPQVSDPNSICFTRFEFSDALRVSVRTVDRMIAVGEIRVRRVRRKTVRILRSDAERYLNGEKLKAEIGKAEMPLPHPGPMTRSRPLTRPTTGLRPAKAGQITSAASQGAEVPPAAAGRKGSQIGKGGKP